MSLVDHSRPGPGVRLSVIPETAGWSFLSFSVLQLDAGQRIRGETGHEELLVVPLSGRVVVQAAGEDHLLQRSSVFEQLPDVVYLPPGTPYVMQAGDGCELAVGSAPAEGRLPARRIGAGEMAVEMRGGANVTRQITHVLAPPLPAERLVVFEVYTPSGNWSSWPPHRHDGRQGSPYLEETYYYRVDPAEGFAIQRVYSPDAGLDELVMARDGDVVRVPEGHHPVVAAPGSNVYYLNFLAGPERSTAVADDPAYEWMRDDWEGRALTLPIGAADGD